MEPTGESKRSDSETRLSEQRMKVNYLNFVSELRAKKKTWTNVRVLTVFGETGEVLVVTVLCLEASVSVQDGSELRELVDDGRVADDRLGLRVIPSVGRHEWEMELPRQGTSTGAAERKTHSS